MPFEERTIRDRIYSDLLKELGPLSNSELGEKAAQHPHFKETGADALEKDIDRFVVHYKYLGIVERVDGKIKWLSKNAIGQGQTMKEPGTESLTPTSRESRHEAVQKLIHGMANGTIRLKDESPQKELKRVKGEIYDEFLRDIDFYNTYGKSLGVSDILETRIYNTALKLRTLGFIEDKEQPSSDTNET